MPKVALLLADGFEEVEAVAVVDILRRAGVDLVLVGLSKEPVSSARNVRIIPDVSIEEIRPEELDMVVLPGGLGGVEKLRSDRRVYELLKALREKGRYISAICAAPTALASFGLLEGKRSTVYPELKEQIKPALFVNEKVVEDSRIITSQGPGTAFAFGLRLVERLLGKDKAKEVAKKMLIDWNDTSESKA